MTNPQESFSAIVKRCHSPLEIAEAVKAELDRCKDAANRIGLFLWECKRHELYKELGDTWAEFCVRVAGHSRQWADYQIKAYQQTQIALPPPEAPQAVEATADGEQLEADIMPDDLDDGLPDPADIAQQVKLPPDCTQELTPTVAQTLYASQQQIGHILRLGHQFRRYVAGIGETENGRYMPASVLAKAVRDVIAEIKERAPYAPCPYCRQGQIAAKCRTCGGAGWVDKTRWEISEKELR